MAVDFIQGNMYYIKCTYCVVIWNACLYFRSERPCYCVALYSVLLCLKDNQLYYLMLRKEIYFVLHAWGECVVPCVAVCLCGTKGTQVRPCRMIIRCTVLRWKWKRSEWIDCSCIVFIYKLCSILWGKTRNKNIICAVVLCCEEINVLRWKVVVCGPVTSTWRSEFFVLRHVRLSEELSSIRWSPRHTDRGREKIQTRWKSHMRGSLPFTLTAETKNGQL